MFHLRSIKTFQTQATPLRKALLSSTPFTNNTPVHRLQASMKPPVYVPIQRVKAPADLPVKEAAQLAVTQNVKENPAHRITPSAAVTERVNPLTAARKKQQLNLVDPALVKPRSKRSSSAPPKIIQAIGMTERESDRRFVDDTGALIDTSQKKIGGIDPRRKPAERRKNSQAYRFELEKGQSVEANAGSVLADAEDNRDRRGKGYRRDSTRIPMGAGVGLIFDSDHWDVDFSDTPRIPKHGECRNPNIICDTPSLEGGSYCAKCAGIFFADPNPRSYTGRLVAQALRSKARQEKADRRIEQLRAAYARFEARVADAAEDDDATAAPLLMAAE